MIYGTDFEGFAPGFVHKRLLRGAAGFLAGGPVGAAAGFLTTGGGSGARPREIVARPGVTLATNCPPPLIPSVHGGCTGVAPLTRRPAPRSTTARPGPISAAEKAGGRRFKFGDFAARAFDPLGLFTSRPEAEPTLAGQPVGQAVMGRYGAAYFPGSKIVDRAVCLRGDIVANDGLCYPRGSITNRERAWPKGRRPLLTGGEMRAISIAARAGKRVEQASKRLQSIGLMKKPASSRRRAAAHPAHPQLGPGS